MSSIPYYIPKARFGYKYGQAKLVDGLERDGLTDVYNQCAMGKCADLTASRLTISRQSQDNWTINSYQRATQAMENGLFRNEITPVSIKGRKEIRWIEEDEEVKRVNL